MWTTTKFPDPVPAGVPVRDHRRRDPRGTTAWWTAWTIGAFALLPVAGGAAYTAVLLLTAGALVAWRGPAVPGRVDRGDLAVLGGTYLAVVALLLAAFRAFTTDHVAGLFVCFGSALTLGVAVPVWHTVWRRRRPLADLGLRWDNWRPTLALALVLGGLQFALTLWGHDLPAPGEWVPLLGMALVVGVFESVFFRGYLQGRLEASFGTVPGTALAAVLYGAYHVGYGMGAGEIVFLTGLGLVYAVAYRLVHNVLVLWPLLTPLGSFYASLESGDVDLPWASLAGFGDVLALMGLCVWLAVRHQRSAGS